MLVAALATFAALAFASRDAAAQLHWDVSVGAGPRQRVLVEKPPSTGDSGGAGVGVAGQVAFHVALVPLVRVGAFFEQEISPLRGEAAARDITSAGLHLKVASPFGRRDLRPYVVTGFGYSVVYARSYRTSIAFPTGAMNQTVREDALVQSAGGGFFQVPLGVGASYRLRSPIEVYAQLDAILGFGHRGSVYEDPGPQVSVEGRPDNNALPSGIDRFAIGLSVGVLLDM